LAVILLIALNWVVVQRCIWPVYLDEASSRGLTALRLSAAGMLGTVQRYEKLPELFADDPLLKQLLQQPGDTDIVDQVNRTLFEANELLGSSDIYVLNRDGMTVAASNYASPTSFVGEDFSFRPYFRTALEGGKGSYSALGAASSKRGYYFSSPITEGNNIRGVVVFKVNIDEMESAWSGSREQEIIVTDRNGIIFMSSEKDWLFRSLSQLSPARAQQIADTRQYADIPVSRLPIIDEETQAGHHVIAVAHDGEIGQFVQVTEPMSQTHWSVHVLFDTKGAVTQTGLSALLLACAEALTAGLIVGIRSRQKDLARRLAMQQQIQHELEARVETRTAALTEAKSGLEKEIQDRRETERALRQTQSDLVHAGKLAALGQMSAALSHELNQPLTAIRAYADSALVLLQLQRADEASSNLGRIVAMADRMAEIGRNLRTFAGKPDKLVTIELACVLNDAIEVATPRLRAVAAQVQVDVPRGTVVEANLVRLTQVFANILSNAADAVEGRQQRRVSITVRQDDNSVIVTVEDTGPGVPADRIPHIFDPFYTTKKSGATGGMGLGLSISYNIVKEFGGILSVGNGPGGGAVFSVKLPVAGMTPTKISEAAE